MQVFEGKNDFPDVDSDFVLCELFPLVEVGEELSPVDVVEHQVKLGRRLEGVVHADQEGRLADGLQDLALRLGVLRRLPLLDDGGLLQDLHGEQVAGVNPRPLAGQEHLAVRPRPEHLEQVKVLHRHRHPLGDPRG